MLPVTFPYDKKSSVSSMLWLSALVIGLTYFITTINTQEYGYIMQILLGVLDLGILCILLYSYVKWLRPALQGKIALELNNQELIFTPQNITIPWKNIRDIEVVKIGQNIRYLYIMVTGVAYKKNIKLYFGNRVGDFDTVSKTVLDYFHKVSAKGG